MDATIAISSFEIKKSKNELLQEKISDLENISKNIEVDISKNEIYLNDIVDKVRLKDLNIRIQEIEKEIIYGKNKAKIQQVKEMNLKNRLKEIPHHYNSLLEKEKTNLRLEKERISLKRDTIREEQFNDIHFIQQKIEESNHALTNNNNSIQSLQRSIKRICRQQSKDREVLLKEVLQQKVNRKKKEEKIKNLSNKIETIAKDIKFKENEIGNIPREKRALNDEYQQFIQNKEQLQERITKITKKIDRYISIQNNEVDVGYDSQEEEDPENVRNYQNVQNTQNTQNTQNYQIPGHVNSDTELLNYLHSGLPNESQQQEDVFHSEGKEEEEIEDKIVALWKNRNEMEEELKTMEQDPLININSLFSKIDDKENGLKQYLSILKNQVQQLNEMIEDIEKMKDAPEKLVNHKIDILKKKEEIRKLEADNKQIEENLQQYQLETSKTAELTTYEEKQLETQLKNAHNRFTIMDKRIMNARFQETEKCQNELSFINEEKVGMRTSLTSLSKLKKELYKKFKKEIDERGYNSETYFDTFSKNNKLRNKLKFIQQDIFKMKSSLTV